MVRFFCQERDGAFDGLFYGIFRHRPDRSFFAAASNQQGADEEQQKAVSGPSLHDVPLFAKEV
jgi:hypothetical protein